MVVLQPIKPGPPRVNLSLKRGRARRALSLLGNNNTQQNLQLAQSLLTISAEEFANKWNFDPIQGVPLTSGRFQWTPVMATNPATSPDPTQTVVVTPPDTTEVVVAATSCDLSAPSADCDTPNPARDESQEQKTRVTLPTPPPSSSSLPSAASPCEVNGGQAGSSSSSSGSDLPKATEAETTAQASSHQCCPRTCACDLSPACDTETGSKGKVSERDSLKKTEADSGIDSDGSLIDEQESTIATAATQNDSRSSTKLLRQTSITEFVRPKKLASTFKVPEPLSHSSTYSKKRPASSLQDQLNQPPHKKVLLHLRA